MLAVLSVCLWGFSYIWSNELIGLGVPVLTFVFLRTLLAGVVLLLFNLVTFSLKKVRLKDIPYFFLLSICVPVVYFLAESYGIKLTGSPSISAMVIATVPVFSLLAGFLIFRERIVPVNILGVALAVLGVCMSLMCKLDVGVGEHFLAGIGLLLVAVFAEVGHASVTKHLSATYKPQFIVMCQFLLGAVLFVPMILNQGLGTGEVSLADPRLIRPVVCLGILCSALAFSLWAAAIKRLGVAKSSVFLAMISIVTAFAAVMLGHETLGLLQWCGLGIAAVGIVLSQLNCR